MVEEPLFLVVCDGGIGSPPMVLAAYIGQDADRMAHAHSRSITGASVLAMAARRTLDPTVADDVASDDDFDGVTPVDDDPAADWKG